MAALLPEPDAWYVCDRYEDCESVPWPSPPYNPKQPKRCVTHREKMTTEITDPELVWRLG